MVTAKCIQKFRNNRVIIQGYRLVDTNGQTQDVKPDNLKSAIREGKINIINLKLTPDNRLVDKKENQLKNNESRAESNKEKFDKYLDKIFNNSVKIMGNGQTWCGTDEDYDDGYTLTTQILDVYESNSDKYGVTFILEFNSNRKEAIAIWQGNGAMGKAIITENTQLSSPIFNQQNLVNIENMMNSFSHKVANWINKNQK